MKVLLKQPNVIHQIREVNDRYRMDGVASILGKTASQQIIWLNTERTLAFICDECAQNNNPLPNFFIEVPNPFSPVQNIAGDVVFVRIMPCDPSKEAVWDYEIEDLREADIQLIEYLLSDGKQVSLAMEYFIKGGC